VAGDYQIIVLSPEMLQPWRFVERVLRKTEFASRCLSVFVDEAHCVSHWGADFRKKYGTLGMVRSFLPSGTSVVAASATLTDQFSHEFVDIDIRNDRPNVIQIVRVMEHAMNTFHDIDFIVPDGMQQPEDIPKAFIYYDDINGGTDMCGHLNSRVPVALHDDGLIRPYNAAMSREYRDNVMQLFRAGIVRVLVCTDAVGMVGSYTPIYILNRN
jgi:superfamily II DNA helicase RecQ